uniref:C2 domain-containing protein n=1 Tax=Haptolina brevifila TaxID=156173 RepID=A0A7S2JCQ8_9EUKA|mmetsp:Transcript_80372/g.159739  ORF Transcript_80372/g.159739 Transcript_80372/m.159739 type:complete len:384 (+) Transcript_80372:151-1302(+)
MLFPLTNPATVLHVQVYNGSALLGQWLITTKCLVACPTHCKHRTLTVCPDGSLAGTFLLSDSKLRGSAVRGFGPHDCAEGYSGEIDMVLKWSHAADDLVPPPPLKPPRPPIEQLNESSADNALQLGNLRELKEFLIAVPIRLHIENMVLRKVAVEMSDIFAGMSAHVAAKDPEQLRKGTLRVSLLHANGLLAADKNGLSDPYAVFTVGGVKKKSTIKKRTLEPQWGGEDFEFHGSKGGMSTLEISIWDHDASMFDKDDKLGSAKVDLAAAGVLDAGASAITIPVVLNTQGVVTLSIDWLTKAEDGQSAPEIAPEGVVYVKELAFAPFEDVNLYTFLEVFVMQATKRILGDGGTIWTGVKEILSGVGQNFSGAIKRGIFGSTSK